jgi:hypothetical protein
MFQLNISQRETKEMTQSKSRKKYKALLLDLDGTTIPSIRSGKPSKEVKEAIKKASKKITVSLATSRPAFLTIPLIKELSINAPSIITGGAEIYDPLTNKMLKEMVMSKSSIRKIKAIFEKFKIGGIINEGKEDLNFMTYKYRKPLQIYSDSLNEKQANEIESFLSKISDISFSRASTWSDGGTGFVISDARATKQHGVLEVAKILGIKTHEIIGVGDGYNDFPLLMACGLKIAMGNAVPALKEIADYVAPSVEEDGVVDVINKFVL